MADLVTKIDEEESVVTKWNNAFTKGLSSVLLKAKVMECFCSSRLLRNSSASNKTRLSLFVESIMQAYHMNPYHSFEHACHVFFSSNILYTNLVPGVAKYFTDLDHLALLFSAFIHDVDHLGVNNAELVSKQHPYAIMFNDQSVAEMRSLQLGFETLTKNESEESMDFLEEIFRYKSNVDFVTFRKIVISLVLCTDIGDKDRSRLTTLTIQDAFNEETGAMDDKLSTLEGRLGALMLMLKCSDVGAPMQSVGTACYWARNYHLENARAALADEKEPMTPEVFCKDQAGFLTHYVLKVASLLQKASIVHPDIANTATSNVTSMASAFTSPSAGSAFGSSLTTLEDVQAWRKDFE